MLLIRVTMRICMSMTTRILVIQIGRMLRLLHVHQKLFMLKIPIRAHWYYCL